MINENFEMTTAVVSDRGLSEKRPQNEDSYLSQPEHGIFAVADGVGGAMAGDVASQMAVEILGEAFANYAETTTPKEIITVAIDRANMAIHQMAGELPQLSSMATTIVALHLAGNVATIAHVGDSRIYRMDQNGHLYRETLDHSVVEEEVRAGRMTPEQAVNHPSRNVISRAVGAENTVEIDIKTIILEPGTTFLLCSDGITRHLSDQEIAELLTTGMGVATLCDQMKEICYSRGAEDNLTALLVKIVDRTQTSLVSPQNLEEETITTARSTFDDFAEQTLETPKPIPDNPAFGLDATEQQIQKNTDNEAEGDLDKVGVTTSEPNTNSVEYSSSRMIVPAVQQPPPPREREFSIFGETQKTHVLHEHRSVKHRNKILRSFLYLLLGGLIGAAGVYFWWQSQPAPQQVLSVNNLEPRSTNVPSSAFEESREIVDRDPAAYVQSKAASTKNAEDHYFLGRALFMSGEHFEAKRQFTLANERLADIDPKKALKIRTDIAMMSSIINDPQATESFKRLFELIKQQKSVTAANSNTNVVSNNNASR